LKVCEHFPTQLQHLNLEETELDALPPCVAQLSSLTALCLAYNPLTSLPPGRCGSVFEKLGAVSQVPLRLNSL
jgi:Leucine-rich repeat (LRR) protein